jgi:hypothetical protein
MSADDQITPRPPDVYWAAVEPEKLGAQVMGRYLEYIRELQLRGVLDLMNRLGSTYYGYDPATDSLSDWISEAGEEGEFLHLHVNEFASLINHQLSLTTSDAIDFDCLPMNDSPEAEAQATLGDQLIRYYMSEGRLERKMSVALLRALLMGKSYVVQLWDAYKGPKVRVEDAPVFGDDGQPVTETVDVEVPVAGQPQMGMQEAPPEFRTEQVQRPVTQERVVRAGDIVHRIYSPVDVAHDIGVREADDVSWYIVRERVDRWELAARYPEHRKYILERPSYNRDETSKYERGQFSDANRLVSRTDQIHVLRCFHDRGEVMPPGLEVLVCGDRVLGPPMPLAYERMPVHPMAPQDMLDTAIGYARAANLLGPQAALNAAAINGLTSSDAGSVPKWAMPKGADVSVDDVAPNMRVVYYTPNAQMPNGGAPELMMTPQFTEAHIRQIDVWKDTLQRLSDINAVVRGESEGKSGADNALIQAQAIQAMGPYEKAFTECGRSLALGIIECMQRFADDERMVRVVGEDEAPTLAYFRKDDLSAIRYVEVDLGDPAMRTFGMRKQVATELREAGDITAEQYLAFLGTGRLDPLWKAQRNQVRLIRSENAALAKGSQVPTLIADCHLDHIREHLALLSSPTLRAQPQLTQVVLTHVMEHETQWVELSMRPALLAATNQAPAPPGPMAGPPVGGPQPPPDANAPPGQQPAERAQVGGVQEVAGVPLPSAPKNAATGVPAQVNGGMQ